MKLKLLKLFKNINVFFFLRAESYKSQPMFGRHGAQKHHDSMAAVSFILNHGLVIYNTYKMFLLIDYTR